MIAGFGKSKLLALIVTALGVLATGCPKKGITFGDSSLNPALPESFKNRTLWKDTGVLQYQLASLSGYVIYKEGDDAWKRRYQVVKPGHAAQLTAIEQGDVYKAKVDQRASVSGNAAVPVLSAAASLDANQTMEIVIADAAIIHIDEKDIPFDLLLAEVQKPNPTKARRAWVQSVLLTKIFRRTYRATAADASVRGVAFGANGKVYNEEGDFVHDSVITMLLVDLDEIGAAAATDLKALEKVNAFGELDETARTTLFRKWLNGARIVDVVEITE